MEKDTFQLIHGWKLSDKATLTTQFYYMHTDRASRRSREFEPDDATTGEGDLEIGGMGGGAREGGRAATAGTQNENSGHLQSSAWRARMIWAISADEMGWSGRNSTPDFEVLKGVQSIFGIMLPECG